jgi:hypothetical protein
MAPSPQKALDALTRFTPQLRHRQRKLQKQFRKRKTTPSPPSSPLTQIICKPGPRQANKLKPQENIQGKHEYVVTQAFFSLCIFLFTLKAFFQPWNTCFETCCQPQISLLSPYYNFFCVKPCPQMLKQCNSAASPELRLWGVLGPINNGNVITKKSFIGSFIGTLKSAF